MPKYHNSIRSISQVLLEAVDAQNEELPFESTLNLMIEGRECASTMAYNKYSKLSRSDPDSLHRLQRVARNSIPQNTVSSMHEQQYVFYKSNNSMISHEEVGQEPVFDMNMNSKNEKSSKIKRLLGRIMRASLL